ncbi:MAG: hypothetical protein VXW87_02235 [Pseudomonadota bacterium]|nr:hypothetical protein [Pseudomonadota bacterium]
MRFYRSPSDSSFFELNEIHKEVAKNQASDQSQIDIVISRFVSEINDHSKLRTYKNEFNNSINVDDLSKLCVLNDGSIMTKPSLYCSLVESNHGQYPGLNQVVSFPDQSVSTREIIRSYQIEQTPLELACLLANASAIEALLEYNPHIGLAPYNLLCSPKPELVTRYFQGYTVPAHLYYDHLSCNLQLFKTSVPHRVSKNDQIAINRIKTLCTHQPEKFYFSALINSYLRYYQSKSIFNFSFMYAISSLINHNIDQIIGSSHLGSIKKSLSLFIDIMVSRSVAMIYEADNCSYITRHSELFKVISKIVPKLHLIDKTVKATSAALDHLYQVEQSTSLTQEQRNYLFESKNLVRALQSLVLGSAFHPNMQLKRYSGPAKPRSGLRV